MTDRRNGERRMSSSDPEHMVVKLPRIFIGRCASGPNEGEWELFLTGYTASLDGVRWFYPTCEEAIAALIGLTNQRDNPLSNWILRERMGH